MSESYVKLRSNYLNGTVDLSIILPNPFLGHNPEKFYRNGKKYPVLWLLHGGSDTFADWITYTSVARLGNFKNLIIVAPSIPNSDFVNQPLVGEGYPICDFFFHELMPFVYNWLPASDDPAQNFLAGDSMGALAAWRYGLMVPEAFDHIGVIGAAPSDYSFLEPWRKLSTIEFARQVERETLPSACDPEGSKMRRREWNNICKFDSVAAFLDSIENTMARFDEAAEKGTLPRVYVAGNRSDARLAAFQKHAESLGARSITFDLLDGPEEPAEFSEVAIEKFVEFIGLPDVGTTDKKEPILPGVHDFKDDSIGRVLH